MDRLRRCGQIIHVVLLNGTSTERIADQRERDLRKMGYYGLVVIKTDQEPALLDLAREVAQRRGNSRTVLESAPRGDSQGNGHAERAVKSVEEVVRLQKLALEDRLGEKLPVSHKAFPWLIEYSVDLLNKMQVGKDGRTAFERLKSKRYRNAILPFGTHVMARVAGKVQGGLL